MATDVFEAVTKDLTNQPIGTRDDLHTTEVTVLDPEKHTRGIFRMTHDVILSALSAAE